MSRSKFLSLWVFSHRWAVELLSFFAQAPLKKKEREVKKKRRK
jgi:hypothetical protein